MDVTSLYNRRASQRWNRLSMGDLFERNTWSAPDKIALKAYAGAFADPEFETLTYRQADEKANQFANALIAKGMQRGDRVLFSCANTVEFFVGIIGTAKAGMVAVPINIMMAPDVIDYIVKQVEPGIVISDAELYPKFAKVFNENGLGGQNTVIIPVGGGPLAGSKTYSEFINEQAVTEPDVEIHADDIYQILYTSGATSMPKGVLHSHMFMFVGATAYALSFGRGVPREVDYKVGQFLPLFHVGSIMTYSALIVGGSVVITRTLNPEVCIKAITEDKITLFSPILPAIMYQVMDTLESNPQLDASSVKITCTGYGVLRPDYHAKLNKIFSSDVMHIGSDGQTECVTDTRWWPHTAPDKYEKNGWTMNYFGVSSPYYATAILDEEGNLSRPNEMGEKVMRSPCIMSGYYKNEEATKEAFRNGWLHSGDACMYDDENLIIMMDRYKDIVKSGGESVPSARVEEVVRTHPAVERVAVIGLPHKTWGEAVTACIVLKPGVKATEEELMIHCRQTLAGFEMPKRIVFLETLPETVNGKILKYVLRHELEGTFEQ